MSLTRSRTRSNTCASGRPPSRIISASACAYGPYGPLPSGATVPGAALKAISNPDSGSTSARPLASGAPERANGLARAASRMTMLALSFSATSGRV